MFQRFLVPQRDDFFLRSDPEIGPGMDGLKQVGEAGGVRVPVAAPVVMEAAIVIKAGRRRRAAGKRRRADVGAVRTTRAPSASRTTCPPVRLPPARLPSIIPSPADTPRCEPVQLRRYPLGDLAPRRSAVEQLPASARPSAVRSGGGAGSPVPASSTVTSPLGASWE